MGRRQLGFRGPLFMVGAAFVAAALLVGGAFVVTAGAASSSPAFVQQVSAHSSGVSSLAVTPSSSVGSGNRLVVQTGVWSSANATVASVTDSAADQFVEVLHFTGSDGTEMSVWTAPVTAGGGTRPTITVKSTAKADVGVAVLEYSGLSSVSDSTVVDQMAHSSATTSAAATVSSGATPATSAANELALGFYVDSGFGDTLTAGSGYTQRANVSNTGDMELLAEDQGVGSGQTPNATAGTGAKTVWLMATIVLKSGTAPLGAAANAVRFQLAPRVGAGAGIVVAPGRANRLSSVRRAALIAASDSSRFVYEALLKHLPPGLLCHRKGTGTVGAVASLTPGWPAWWWRKPHVA
jgi:hypothetical protein